ncbi:MAG: hypothetical protein JSS45_13840 [Proteobacteria bacterium]|nr:hypothetical protein [Pseudomonadota bacterium]
MGERDAVPLRRRRWPRWLAAFAVVLLALVATAAYLLQPARLTTWLLANAGQSLKLDLRTSGPGHFALRPGLRLTLPGLSVTDPASGKRLLRAQRVDLALPWDTLRGRSAAIGRIELVAPDIDLQALQAWQDKQPPSTQPLKLPTIRRGVAISHASVHGRGWSLSDLDVALPRLGDGQPLQLSLRGTLLRDRVSSHFSAKASASRIAGVGQGLRIDGLAIAMQADGALPSVQASGHVLASDRIDVDLHGQFQTLPIAWTKAIDSSFASPGDTPFTFNLLHTPTTLLATSTSSNAGWQLRAQVGDGLRQPQLSVQAQANGEVLIDASLDAKLSRWPDAWPGLPAGLGRDAAALRFRAEYHGPLLPPQPVAFTLERGATRLQGRTKLADLRAWIRGGIVTLLPPLQGTLDTAQLNVAGVQLKGVHAEIRDDAPAATPAGVGKP